MMRPNGVEKQVRPKKTWIYSYDFRNKTVAGIQNDGWTFETTSNFYVDANGIYNTATQMKKIIYPVNVSNATKITVHSTSIGSGNRDCSVGLSVDWSETANTYYYSGGIVGGVGSDIIFGYIPIGNGTAEITEEFDLVNKTVKYVCPLANLDSTYTLTDAQITTIRSSNNIIGNIDKSLRLADISIKVEY